MKTQEGILGLDLGSGFIRCVAGELRDGRVFINGAAQVPSRGIRGGVIVNMDRATAVIKAAVAETCRMADLKLENLIPAAGITGRQIYSKGSSGLVTVKKGKPITQDDVKRVLEQAKSISLPANHEIIYVHPNQYAVDSTRGIKNPVGLAGVRLELEAYIVTADRVFLENITACLSSAGIRQPLFFFQPIAASYGVMDEEDFEEGAILLDIGRTTTDVAVWQDEMLLNVDVMEWGGDYITEAIAAEFLMSQATAAHLKEKYGVVGNYYTVDEAETITVRDSKRGVEYGVARRRLSQVIEQAVGDLLTRIRAELERAGLYRVTRAGTPILLVGGTSALPGAREMAEEIFSLPVTIGTPRGVESFSEAVATADFAVAVGLVKMASQSVLKPRPRVVFKQFWENIKDMF
ncbi:MAG: cell division protein FtsA [candidate division WOR-3 bacterium]